jgi:hypothetical protein
LGQGQGQLGGGQGWRLQSLEALVELIAAGGDGDGLLQGIEARLGAEALLLLLSSETRLFERGWSSDLLQDHSRERLQLKSDL